MAFVANNDLLSCMAYTVHGDLIAKDAWYDKGSIFFIEELGNFFLKLINYLIFTICPVSIISGQNGLSHLLGGLSNSVGP